MRTPIQALSALSVSLLLPPAVGLACWCNNAKVPVERMVQESFRASNAVFLGEVIESKLWTDIDKQGVRLELRVLRVFKGDLMVGVRVPADTAPSEAACGKPFQVGELVLIYARSTAPVNLDSCDSSGELIESLEQIPELLRLQESDESHGTGG